MRALVRELVELAIGDRLAATGHSVGDLVGIFARVDRGVGHSESERTMSSPRKRGPITTDLSLEASWITSSTTAWGYGSRLRAGTTHFVVWMPLTAAPRSSHWPCRRLRTWSAARSACCAV